MVKRRSIPFGGRETISNRKEKPFVKTFISIFKNVNENISIASNVSTLNLCNEIKRT